MSRIIEALEPFYGIQRGGDHKSDNAQKSKGQIDPLIANKTQEELAAELGIDLKTYKRYKQLGDLIPEFQTMIEEGNISYTTASDLVRRLDLPPVFAYKEC